MAAEVKVKARWQRIEPGEYRSGEWTILRGDDDDHEPGERPWWGCYWDGLGGAERGRVLRWEPTLESAKAWIEMQPLVTLEVH